MVEEFEDIRDVDAALAKSDRRMILFEVTSAILGGASPIHAGASIAASVGAISLQPPGSARPSGR